MCGVSFCRICWRWPAVACLGGASAQMGDRLRGRCDVSKIPPLLVERDLSVQCHYPAFILYHILPLFHLSSSIITNAGSTTHRILMLYHHLSSSPPLYGASADVAALPEQEIGSNELCAGERPQQITSQEVCLAACSASRRKRNVRCTTDGVARGQRQRRLRERTSLPMLASGDVADGSLSFIPKRKTSVSPYASRQRHAPTNMSIPTSFTATLATLLCLTDIAAAAPTNLQKRDGSEVKVIVPVVVIGVLLVIAALTTCMRRGWHGNMARWTTNAANAFGPNAHGTTANNGGRELTAQQLLNSNNGTRELTASQLAGSDAPEAVPRTRRSRRANRRASQISTHSLPVYNKEPGEQEVIIYRGPEDMMEEPPTTAHVVMPSVAEGNESPDFSVDAEHLQANVYAEMPDSPHDMPLLSGDESSPGDIDNSRAHLITSRRGGSARPSMETLSTAEDNGSGRSPIVDPRGEAPPYFEVVPLDNLSPANSPEIPTQPSPEVPAQEPPENPRRRSLFGLFHGRHHASRSQNTPAQASSSLSHRRDNSNVSNISVPSTIARPRSRAQSRAGQHRPSVSGSGFSVLSRSRSRLLDSPHLTSPSNISLNSISAPLTHTTVRTEFTYPRTGPTPEQIKLISSRESFARFGLPYGHDAIAFHASSSRMDLPSHPPPEFEERAGPSGSPLVPSASPVITPATPRVVDDTLVHDDTVHEADETAPEEEEHSSGSESSPATSDSAEAPALPKASDEGNKVVDASDATQPSIAVSSPPGLNDGAAAATAAGASSSSASAARASSSVPAPLDLRPRPASRASSFTSFATAEESLPSATSAATPYGSASSKLTLPKIHIPDAAAGAATPSTVSEPSTPRPATSHLHENTDTTVTLTPSTPASAATEVGRAL